MSSNQINHYLFRVGDATHLWSSSVYNIWGIHSSTSSCKYFLKNAKKGDCLWFVKGNSNGLLVAVAIYENSEKRNDNSLSFDKLGWVNTPGNWDTDIYFKNFKKIEKMNLFTQIKGSAANPRIYNEKCLVNLPIIYSEIYPVEVNNEQIIVKKIIIEGITYLKDKKNNDIYDFETKEFVGTYIDGVLTIDEESDEEESDEEESDEEEVNEEKESLQKILLACTTISNEITNLTSLLNSRIDRLDRLGSL
jgi:hypothetical protein